MAGERTELTKEAFVEVRPKIGPCKIVATQVVSTRSLGGVIIL
jgi:hypothetical protein